jgi:transcriptional regulator with XRE-family HTH domain
MQPSRADHRDATLATTTAREPVAAVGGRVPEPLESRSKAEMGKRSRDPCDTEIAKRVRALRLQRGLSQTELGEVLGVTFQQVQKYERGTNRISAGRLYRIADVLDVPVSFFYDGFDERGSELGRGSVGVEFDFLQTGGAMRLVRAFTRIKDNGIRQKLLLLTESLAGE